MPQIKQAVRTAWEAEASADQLQRESERFLSKRISKQVRPVRTVEDEDAARRTQGHGSKGRLQTLVGLPTEMASFGEETETGARPAYPACAPGDPAVTRSARLLACRLTAENGRRHESGHLGRPTVDQAVAADIHPVGPLMVFDPHGECGPWCVDAGSLWACPHHHPNVRS